MATEIIYNSEVQPCRTCGVYYMMTSNYLKPLFKANTTQDYSEMIKICSELANWNIVLSENDGHPQSICRTCVMEFQKFFKFRSSCLETQKQFRINFCHVRNDNQRTITIKTEKNDYVASWEKKNLCDFMYVDDISDDGYSTITANTSIKGELIEATVPTKTMNESSCTRVAGINSIPKMGINMEVQVMPSSLTSENLPTIISNVSTISASNINNDPIMSTNNKGTNIKEIPFSHFSPLHFGLVECCLCHHISTNSDEHNQHMYSVHDYKDLKCHLCGKIFKNSTLARLKFHWKWHNLHKHVKCVQCGFLCTSRCTLREHFKALHAKIPCHICKKMLLPKKMKRHLRQHDLCNQFEQELQKKAASSLVKIEYSDIRNEEQKDENAQHEYQPPQQISILNSYLGGALLSSNNNGINDERQKHLAKDNNINSNNNDDNDDDDDDIVEEKYNLLCAYCNQTFSIRSDLIKHVKLNHSCKSEADTAQSTKIIQSSFVKNCNNSLTQTINTYLSDISDMTNESNHSISIYVNCNQKQQDKNDAISLYNVNDDSQSNDSSRCLPYACADCSEIFETIEQLRSHHLKHAVNNLNKQKFAFSCLVCGKRFNLRFSLNRHLVKHKN